MYIEEVILNEFKRLDLLGVTKLTYTPKSPYQLFTGKNGIGKSSLISEISPLPCEATDLREGGYKYVKLSHRGSKYELLYELHKKLESSFKKDGVELNQGGTIKAQRSLIWEHFQYGDDIHDLLLGNTLLSTMTPQVRREWFVRMSKSDINYAISFYNRLKSTERDIKGAIKLNKQRLINEQAKLMDVNEINRVKDDSNKLKGELNHLLPFMEQTLTDKSIAISQLLENIEHLSSSIIDLKYNVKYEGLSDINELRTLEKQFTFEKDKLQNDYKSLIDKITELQDIVNKTKALADRPLEEIDKELFSAKNELHAVTEKYNGININVGDNAEDQLFSFIEIDRKLREVLTNFPTNYKTESGERFYTKEKEDALLAKLDELNSQCIRLKSRIEHHEKELDGLNNIHDVHCPNCNFSFKPGVDCNRIDSTKAMLEKLNEEFETANKRYAELKEIEAKYTEIRRSLHHLRELYNHYPLYNGLFAYIFKDIDKLHDNPYMLINSLPLYQEALQCKSRMVQLTSVISKLEEERIRRIAAEGSDMEFIYKNINDMELQLIEIDKRIKFLVNEINIIGNVIFSNEDLTTKSTRLKGLIKELEDTALLQVKFRNNEKLLEIIKDKQVSLSNLENTLSSIQQSETIVKQITDMITQLEEEYKAVNVLTTILSPQDGLIAESLLGFLNLFLDEMSSVIEHIWSYRMKPFMEIGEDGIELDYRFKVEVEGIEDPVKDISKLSRGQKEIMDFVFKLLVMQHLDMSDYPVYMDEVGASFDPYHRDKLYQYIKMLVEDNQISQVFVISHIASSHDALSLADRCVLDTDATMIDEEVNKVLVLE